DREITLGLHEHVFALNESRHLRATMDGIITSVLIFTEGMLSSAITNVAVISDQDISAFVVQGRAAEDMHPGDRFEMTLGNEIFTMVVVDPDDFGFVRDEFAGAGIAQAFLAFAGAMPSPGFETSGRVHIPLDEVSDALFIPASAVRRYGERTFVYVLNDGLREVRDVQAGLEADGIVEIVHGLSEGEHVIL
ncbi:MAG: hypothetical protein FWB75_07305, partial [Oscillospiraceae bacterium]|nr:hypothetical protein [Oscillospiraceae bacterium]